MSFYHQDIILQYYSESNPYPIPQERDPPSESRKYPIPLERDPPIESRKYPIPQERDPPIESRKHGWFDMSSRLNGVRLEDIDGVVELCFLRENPDADFAELMDHVAEFRRGLSAFEPTC